MAIPYLKPTWLKMTLSLLSCVRDSYLCSSLLRSVSLFIRFSSGSFRRQGNLSVGSLLTTNPQLHHNTISKSILNDVNTWTICNTLSKANRNKQSRKVVLLNILLNTYSAFIFALRRALWIASEGTSSLLNIQWSTLNLCMSYSWPSDARTRLSTLLSLMIAYQLKTVRQHLTAGCE